MQVNVNNMLFFSAMLIWMLFRVLDPIALNKKTVTCPFIDVIDYENFAYRAQDEGARGAFDWELYYKRLPLLPEDLKNMPEPFKYVDLYKKCMFLI